MLWRKIKLGWGEDEEWGRMGVVVAMLIRESLMEKLKVIAVHKSSGLHGHFFPLELKCLYE